MKATVALHATTVGASTLVAATAAGHPRARAAAIVLAAALAFAGARRIAVVILCVALGGAVVGTRADAGRRPAPTATTQP